MTLKWKRTEIERFDWFIERIQRRVAFDWLGERSAEKLHGRELSRNQPTLRFDVILQHDWPIEQCLLHIRVFFGGGGNEESMFWCFHPLADKTNNEHLLKPFFKVILKSLYLFLILTQNDELPDCCGGTTVWWDKNSLLALDRTIGTFDSLLIPHQPLLAFAEKWNAHCFTSSTLISG